MRFVGLFHKPTMSINVTADPRFLSVPEVVPRQVESWRAKDERLRSPYLVFVWVAVALGVLAMFEPSPSDLGIALLVPVGFLCGNLRWDKRLTLPLILLSLFGLANLISLCYAIDLEVGALYFAITLFMLVSWMFTVGVLMRYEEQGLRALMSAFTVGGVASSLLALLCYFNLAPLGDWLLLFDRVKGFFKDPNVFGPYLVIVAVYALHRAETGASVAQKLLWLASCLISSLGVLLSYSRAAWMNYAVTLFCFLGLTLFANRASRAARRNLLVLVALALIIGAAVSYAMTIPQVREVAAYRADIQDYDAGRFANYYAALWLGLGNPLGVGPGQSFMYLDYATHNLFLRLLSENGVLGLISLTTFILFTLVRSVTLSQRGTNLFQRSMFALVAAALCGGLLNSLAIDTLHWRHLWLLLALGWMPLWAGEETLRSKQW